VWRILAAGGIGVLAIVLAAGCDPGGEPPVDDDTDGDDDTLGDDDTVGDDDTSGDDDISGDDDSGGGELLDLEARPDDGSNDCGDRVGSVEDAAALIEIATSRALDGGVSRRIAGDVGDGAYPRFYASTVAAGGCELLHREPGFCDPPCDPGTVCAVDDTCQPFPTSISGGVLTITGLGDDLELQPGDFDPGSYLLEDPPLEQVAAGTILAARLEGDAFPPVTLSARAVEPLESPLTDETLVLEDGSDAQVLWTAGPDPDVCVQITLVAAPEENHGGLPEYLVRCEGPDTGSLSIPAAVVDALPLSATGSLCDEDCHASSMVRYFRDAVDVELGRAELVVLSRIQLRYEHLQ